MTPLKDLPKRAACPELCLHRTWVQGTPQSPGECCKSLAEAGQPLAVMISMSTEQTHSGRQGKTQASLALQELCGWPKSLRPRSSLLSMEPQDSQGIKRARIWPNYYCNNTIRSYHGLYSVLLIILTTLWSRFLYCPHFTDE